MLVIAVLATIVAVILDLPAQFGGVGTDAASEFAGRGTAVSPPLLPLAVLAVSLLLLRRDDAWATLGCVALAILGILFAIGSVGEALAAGTPDVAKAVLVGSGIVGGLIGVTLASLAIAAILARRQAAARDSAVAD